MHKHAVEADMVDVFAVDFEVVDGLSAGKLLDSDDRRRPTRPPALDVLWSSAILLKQRPDGPGSRMGGWSCRPPTCAAQGFLFFQAHPALGLHPRRFCDQPPPVLTRGSCVRLQATRQDSSAGESPATCDSHHSARGYEAEVMVSVPYKTLRSKSCSESSVSASVIGDSLI